MQIQQVLVQLECVENEMAGFYDWLSEVFEADGDASGLFVPKKTPGGGETASGWCASLMISVI